MKLRTGATIIIFILINMIVCLSALAQSTRVDHTLQVGTSAPSFEITSLKSGNLETVLGKDRSTLLVFSNAVCSPCQLLNKSVLSSWAQSSSVKVAVIAYGSAKDLTEKYKNLPVDVYVGNDIIAKSFGIQVVPQLYLVSKEGRILWKQTGYRRDQDQTWFTSVIKKVTSDS